MSLPPADRPPEIPGASSWTGAAAPVFVNPTPAATSSEQFELAGWGARFAAMIIDHLLRLVVAVAVTIIGFVAIADDPFSVSDSANSPFSDSTLSHSLDAWDPATDNLIWLVFTAIGLYYLLAFVYAPVFMARWRGATPGKRMLGIRVIREDGRELGFGGAFLREPVLKGIVINLIGGSFVLVPLVSYLWPLWDRECRAGHDFMARTRVVKARGGSALG